jgi:hypothetical protein
MISELFYFCSIFAEINDLLLLILLFNVFFPNNLINFSDHYLTAVKNVRFNRNSYINQKNIKNFIPEINGKIINKAKINASVLELGQSKIISGKSDDYSGGTI